MNRQASMLRDRMPYSTQTKEKEIAWNGIRFLAPSDWEVGKIGLRYLMLETEFGPALEIKWGTVKGNFSHKKHLQRLTATQDKPSGKPVKKSPLPEEWAQALEPFDATGFSWKGEAISGKGALLYCPTCHTATLIQFYFTGDKKDDRTSLPVLASFQDHRTDNQMLWSVYDIRALLPEELVLTRHRLEAGFFELAFGSKETNLTLYRWGPASVLLQDRELEEFVDGATQIPISEPHKAIDEEITTLDWAVSPRLTGFLRWWIRVTGNFPFQNLRVWHLKKKNRILGVRAEGKKPIDPLSLEKICTEYESL